MLADSPGSHHSSKLNMNPCNSALISISMRPAYKHAYSTYKWIDSVSYPLCLLLPAQLCHLSSSRWMCVRSWYMCVHTRLHAIYLLFTLSLCISFAYNIQSAGGQRSLLCIRSASSNSERHQSHPTTIPCITMRWRGQWKTIMNTGSVEADWAPVSLAKVCFQTADSPTKLFIAIVCWQQKYQRKGRPFCTKNTGTCGLQGIGSFWYRTSLSFFLLAP